MPAKPGWPRVENFHRRGRRATRATTVLITPSLAKPAPYCKSMAIIEADAEARTPFEQDVAPTQRHFDNARFEGIVRLYSARQVVEQRGTIPVDYSVAREAAAAFYDRLRELFAERQSVTTFGPYSPGQGVAMKRMGIEVIYLGGWA